MSAELKEQESVQLDKEDIIVDGYRFQSPEDAALAKQELKKIEYLQEHVDYQDTAMLRNVYQKAIESRAFRTPIGQNYLHSLRRLLVKEGYSEEELPYVTMYHNYTVKKRKETSTAKQRINPAKKREKADKLTISILLNVFLALLVVGMFAIAYTSEYPNILNYERAIVDKYAAWEQDLTEREDALREEKLQSGK
ncbi:MAG: hypothetical protein E7299_02525 [Lachnospiraceae bacterium]|nr:hypothetical protein [Lachnospiraceae bacterium]